MHPMVVGREAQLAELATVTGLHDSRNAAGERIREPAPPLVVVYGGVSTGKTVSVAQLLRAHAEAFAMVDCTGVMTTKAFYREILGQLQSCHRGLRKTRDEENALDNDTDDDGGVTITDAPEQVTPRARSKRQRRSVAAKEAASSDSEEDAEDGANGDGPPSIQPVLTEPEEFNTLNFLSFVKALRICMDKIPADQQTLGRRRRTLYVALDRVDRLISRGLSKLVTCLLAVNDQLDYLHALENDGAPWTLCLVLITRAVSLDFELFVHTSHPAFILFPAYTKEEIAMIVAHNIQEARSARAEDKRDSKLLRRWLAYMYDLLPQTHNDWLEFQHVAVQLLPSLDEFLGVLSSTQKAPQWTQQLQLTSRNRVSDLEKCRRRHLFGYDDLESSGRHVEAAYF
ncbi:hypothetical protein ATCC90586_009412 [Pythium insidiosum]|nr:hypothetical protein ATCC90586_009412 [Pythium insidiosum]